MEDNKYFSDAELQARLNSLRKEDPDLHCSQNKKVIKLCINPKCINHSLRCGDMTCKSCGRDAHPSCLSVPLDQFIFLVNQRCEKVKGFILKILEIQDAIIDKLKKSQKTLINMFSLGFESDHDQSVLDQIFDQKGNKELVGKQTQSLCEQLQQNVHSEARSKELLQIYTREAQRRTYQVSQLKKKAFCQFLGKDKKGEMDKKEKSRLDVEKHSINVSRQIEFELQKKAKEQVKNIEKVEFENFEKKHLNKYDKPNKIISIEFTKICDIGPGDEDINLLAKVVKVEKKNKKVELVLGDETGVVNAFMFQNPILEGGNTLCFFNAQANVYKEHIQVHMMRGGRIEKARREIHGVNILNDISAKEWVQLQ